MSERIPNTRVFDALANPYRRQLLLALLENNPQDDDDLDPLNLLKPGEATDDPESAQVRVNHTHLPKLDKMGFIEWDRASGELSKGPQWEEIAPLLKLIYDHRDELPNEWL